MTDRSKSTGRSKKPTHTKKRAETKAPTRPIGDHADERVRDQAARFNRIRQDHSSEIAEDYVELIAQLIRAEGEARTVDIARRLGVSHVTVTKTIKRLQEEGLVRSQPYRSIFLTDNGEDMARRSEERHALVVRFLKMLGVDDEHAEADAEGIEHHLSAATMEAIERFVSSRG